MIDTLLSRIQMTLQHRARKTWSVQVIPRGSLTASLCVLALAACHSPQPPSPAAMEPTTATPETVPAQSATVRHRSLFAIPAARMAAAVAGADDYQDLIDRYPEATRAQINAWYAKLAAGPIAFTSNAQWQWMKANDYPTPDDILRAATMSDAQLRELAVQGDTKANFLYLTRLLDDVEHAGSLSRLTGSDQATLEGELNLSMDRALASGSAFAGYLYGNYYRALHGEDNADLGNAAGLMWADRMGDSNVAFRSPRAGMGFPGVSGVRAAELCFDMYAAAARVNPYFLTARIARGELLMPVQ